MSNSRSLNFRQGGAGAYDIKPLSARPVSDKVSDALFLGEAAYVNPSAPDDFDVADCQVHEVGHQSTDRFNARP
jgi:hypothetical protein